MNINEYNSFHKYLEKIIKQQQKIADIVSKNTIVYEQSQLFTQIKSISQNLTLMTSSFEFQQLLASSSSHLLDMINQNFSPALKSITSATYDSLLNCDLSTLKTLQNTIAKLNISNLNIDSLDVNTNDSITYEDETFTTEEINDSTSKLLIKASTGTIEFSDIQKHPILSVSLIIIMYIISSLVIPDLYSSAKLYIKENYFSNKSEITVEDYSNFRIITTDILNVRRNPSTNSDIVGKLYYLNVVKVTDTCPYWLKIEYIDSKNNIQITGWVSKKYTSDFSKETENLFNLDNN